LKILLADDDVDDRAFFKDALMQIYPTAYFVGVEDGEGAFNILLKEEFDYVFLDLNMPLMNGRECLKLIRSKKMLAKNKQEIPVIILSTTIDPEIEKACEDLRALCVSKPFSFEALKAIIAKIIYEYNIP
jgi:CheY-like chemotaxis protein